MDTMYGLQQTKQKCLSFGKKILRIICKPSIDNNQLKVGVLKIINFWKHHASNSFDKWWI